LHHTTDTLRLSYKGNQLILCRGKVLFILKSTQNTENTLWAEC